MWRKQFASLESIQVASAAHTSLHLQKNDYLQPIFFVCVDSRRAIDRHREQSVAQTDYRSGGNSVRASIDDPNANNTGLRLNSCRNPIASGNQSGE
jgi:hypothetical protein